MGRAGTLHSIAGISKARLHFFNAFRRFPPDSSKTEADPGLAEAASAKAAAASGSGEPELD